MNILERRIENQVQFWSLLGPFLILLSVAVLLFKLSTHWYFPLSALVGIPLCVKWKMKGMAAALACLFTLAIVGYPSIEWDERYWHVGMSLAMAFSFIVLTLSLEEVEEVVEKLQLESHSRLDNFLLLDEKMKNAEREWLLEKERFQSQVMALTQDVAQMQEDKQTFYKLVQLSKDELVQLRTQHDQLLQELFYKKQQIAQLNEKLEETETTIQAFVNSDAEQTLQRLSESLSKAESDREAFKAQAELARSLLEGVKQELKDAKPEREKFLQERLQMQEKEKLFLAEQNRHKRENEAAQGLLKAHQEKLAALEQEKSLLQGTLNRLQQQYEYTRQTEGQHKLTIQQQVQKIEDLEKEVATKDKDIQLIQKCKSDLENQLILEDKKFKLHYEDLQGQLKHQQELTNRQIKTEQQNWKQQLDDICEELAQTHVLLFKQEEELKKKDQDLQQAQKQVEGLLGDLQAQRQCAEKVEQDRAKLEKAYAEELAQAHASLSQQEEELRGKEQALKCLQQRIESMQADLDLEQQSSKERQQQFLELEQKIQIMEKSKDQLEQVLADLKVRLERSQKLEEPTQKRPETLSYVEGHARPIDAMYRQLKEQFKEKSEVLDATRKELFQAREQLTSLQKECEEQQLFSISEAESLLEKDLTRLNGEYEKMQKNYEKELDTLHELIESLFNQSLSKPAAGDKLDRS